VNDDPTGPEPSVAIELSRRKTIQPGPGPSAVAPERAAPIAVVRRSLAPAWRIAAPYMTTTRIAVSRLTRDPMARAGALILALLAMFAIFADLLASELPIACRWRGAVYALPDVTHPAELRGLDSRAMQRTLAPGDWVIPTPVQRGAGDPSAAADLPAAPLAPGHPLGTDASGRDVLAAIVHGARAALGPGLLASAVLVAIGVALGALAGFAGGVADAVVSRLVEALMAIPTLLLVLVVASMVPGTTQAAVLATVALTRWTELARLVRAETLVALRADYVAAARALGAPAARVLWRHVLPNVIAPAIVAAAFALAWVVLAVATVDFLRAGTETPGLAPHASWGEMLGESRLHPGAWWLVAFPGAALLSTLIALHLVAEGARNALDPRLRGVIACDPDASGRARFRDRA